jgi:hypothetical protein
MQETKVRLEGGVLNSKYMSSVVREILLRQRVCPV